MRLTLSTAGLPVCGVLILGGCASALSVGESQYGCSGLPNGVQCMSSREVYEASERSEVVSNPGEESRRGQPAQPDRTRARPAPADAGPVQRVSTEPGAPVAHSPANARGAALPVSDPKPLRTEARVMRILITPWEDEDGNLRGGQLVFTEIEPRRWAFGAPAEYEPPRFFPLQQEKPVQPKGKEIEASADVRLRAVVP